MKVVWTNSPTSPGSISPRTLCNASTRRNVVPGLNLALAGNPSIRMVSSTSIDAAVIRGVPKRSLASRNQRPITGGGGGGSHAWR